MHKKEARVHRQKDRERCKERRVRGMLQAVVVKMWAKMVCMVVCSGMKEMRRVQREGLGRVEMPVTVTSPPTSTEPNSNFQCPIERERERIMGFFPCLYKGQQKKAAGVGTTAAWQQAGKVFYLPAGSTSSMCAAQCKAEANSKSACSTNNHIGREMSRPCPVAVIA